MREKICAAVSILGFLILLGTAGASDLFGLSLKTIALRGGLGLALFLGGGFVGGFMR